MSESAVKLAAYRAPALVGAASFAVLATLRLRDPHTSGSYGVCPFLAITGQPCPACGGLRAVNDLAHGDVMAALSSNLLVVVLIAVLAIAWVLWIIRRARGIHDRMIVLSGRAGLVVLGAVLVFGIVRVTPWGSWLAP